MGNFAPIMCSDEREGAEPPLLCLTSIVWKHSICSRRNVSNSRLSLTSLSVSQVLYCFYFFKRWAPIVSSHPAPFQLIGQPQPENETLKRAHERPLEEKKKKKLNGVRGFHSNQTFLTVTYFHADPTQDQGSCSQVIHHAMPPHGTSANNQRVCVCYESTRRSHTQIKRRAAKKTNKNVNVPQGP